MFRDSISSPLIFDLFFFFSIFITVLFFISTVTHSLIYVVFFFLFGLSLLFFCFYQVYIGIKQNRVYKACSLFGIDQSYWDEMTADERKGIHGAYLDSIRREMCELVIEYHNRLLNRGSLITWHSRRASLIATQIVTKLDCKYDV